MQIVTNAKEAIYLCGHLRQYYGLDSSNYDRFKDKILMKKLINNNEYLIPNYTVFHKDTYFKNKCQYLKKLTSLLSFPFIVKPVDSMGCLEVEKICNKTELEAWCEKASLSQIKFEVDEYIAGKVYNCDSYIKDSKIIFTQISECSNSCFDFLS